MDTQLPRGCLPDHIRLDRGDQRQKRIAVITNGILPVRSAGHGGDRCEEQREVGDELARPLVLRDPLRFAAARWPADDADHYAFTLYSASAYASGCVIMTAAPTNR